MTGSIEKRGKNSWRLVVSGGYDYTGKKRIKYTRTITTTSKTEPGARKEAEKELAKFIAEIETGQAVTTSKIRFSAFVERWLKDYAEKNLEPKTLARYKAMLDSRIVPYMGHLKLEQIKPGHLNDFYNNLQENGIRLDKKYIAKKDFFDKLNTLGLSMSTLSEKADVSKRTIAKFQLFQEISATTAAKISKATEMKTENLFDLAGEPGALSAKTIKHHHQLISTILQHAVEWQYLAFNPALRVKPPKVKKVEVSHYEDEETLTLLAALDEEPIKYKTMVILDIFTGMRRGELMGLKWKAIDLENRNVDISQSSQYVSGYGTFIKDPKNDTSKRLVAIPPHVINHLKQYKIWQESEKEKAGDFWEDRDWLFTQWNGRPMHPDTISQWFPNFIKRHDLPKITFHGLRHTNASLLITDGMDIVSLSKHLGHSLPSTSMNMYGHKLKRAERESSNRLQKRLVKIKDEPE